MFQRNRQHCPKGMIIGVETYLSEITVHLDESTTIPKERRDEDKSVADTFEEYSTNKNRLKKNRLDGRKEI